MKWIKPVHTPLAVSPLRGNGSLRESSGTFDIVVNITIIVTDSTVRSLARKVEDASPFISSTPVKHRSAEPTVASHTVRPSVSEPLFATILAEDKHVQILLLILSVAANFKKYICLVQQLVGQKINIFVPSSFLFRRVRVLGFVDSHSLSEVIIDSARDCTCVSLLFL